MVVGMAAPTTTERTGHVSALEAARRTGLAASAATLIDAIPLAAIVAQRGAADRVQLEVLAGDPCEIPADLFVIAVA
jgi:hypothetical protein